VTVQVAANTTGFGRTGTVTIAGTTVTITQQGTAVAPGAPTNLRVVR
jgi:hypothetical protein